jgi:hypothetical protein
VDQILIFSRSLGACARQYSDPSTLTIDLGEPRAGDQRSPRPTHVQLPQKSCNFRQLLKTTRSGRKLRSQKISSPKNLRGFGRCKRWSDSKGRLALTFLIACSTLDPVDSRPCLMGSAIFGPCSLIQA